MLADVSTREGEARPEQGQEQKGLLMALRAGGVKRLEPGRNLSLEGTSQRLEWGGVGLDVGGRAPGLQIHVVQVTVDGAVGALTILPQGDHITHPSSRRHDMEGEEGAVSGN